MSISDCGLRIADYGTILPDKIFRKAARIISVFLLFTFLQVSGQSQSLNYSVIFGSDWQKAMTFIDENNSWIKSALDEYDIPYNEAVAVVFPELVRYSALRDKMEITLLKTLYRNLGDEYADFSVGVFQIKPSFAEKIHSESFKIMGKKAKNMFRKRSAYKDNKLYRAAIITDLEDPKTELIYVIAFFKICDAYFEKEWQDERSRIIFLATAYNTGFWKSAEEIEEMSDKKFFNTKLFKTENYNYADVSWYWYDKYTHH
jgi:hypothetical protein